jgi:sulfate/thiosulfate transport system substrate-binding protein
MRITVVTVLILACAPGPTRLLNVSYDATREFYRAYDSLFVANWRARTGELLTIEQSHAGSSAQAHAVIDGLAADVVTLASPSDIDAIARAGLTDTGWAAKFPHRSAPFTTTIVFLVRAGNPKGIRDWPDLVRPGITVITANPKTSGGARWAYLAAWGATLARTHDDTGAARAYVAQLYGHVPALQASARAATTAFVERGAGDVLLAWETDALLATHVLAPGKVEMVTPSVSILADPPIAIVDQIVDRKGTRRVATAYLEGLYAPEAQALAARFFFRPSDRVTARQFTVDSVFHGWREAQRVHFADGGTFDHIGP